MTGCGVLALALSGGIGAALAAACGGALVVAWVLESRGKQLPARAARAAALLSLPLFYLDWSYQRGLADPARAGVGTLTHFILFLSIVKLWQVKRDRDWLFLYLISFFQVLLAAGFSLDPSFVAALALYAFCALSTAVCFEIRKTRRRFAAPETRLRRPERAKLFGRRARRGVYGGAWGGEARRLPLVALALLLFIFALALPIFFITPRFGGGASAARGRTAPPNLVGFTDEVRLGEFGRLEQSDNVVMRVRVEGAQSRGQILRWRGVALDEFDGGVWRKSRREIEYRAGGGERNFFLFGTTEALHRLTTQTFFVEPMNTPVLFAASRAIAVQGAFPYVGRDPEDALTSRARAGERITYRAYSDTVTPGEDELRADSAQYPYALARYRRLPARLDARVAELTRRLFAGNGVANRYDAARIVEAYFRQNFKYSLDRKAGGPDPLADFLFNVRAGHCEYYSTAMAIMLRTAGLATRVVNGFQMGEYNDAADFYTVRQRDAHSWVEVYFPASGTWVTFDPTPTDGRPGTDGAASPRGRLSKYAEALELFWIQYVVTYDKQEQRQLTSLVRGRLSAYGEKAARALADGRARLALWWQALPPFAGDARGGGFKLVPPVLLLLVGLSCLLFMLLTRVRRGHPFGRLASRGREGRGYSTVAFYDRMTKALGAHGHVRAADQTPLEFAAAVGVPEALMVTRAYNRVRFGAGGLTPDEAARIEEWLGKLEGKL